MEGDKKNGDPVLRPEVVKPEENELTQWISDLAAARSASPALRNGSYRNVMVQPKQLIFERRCGDDRVLVALNADGSTYHADFNAEAGRAVDLITGQVHDFGGGQRSASLFLHILEDRVIPDPAGISGPSEQINTAKPPADRKHPAHRGLCTVISVPYRDKNQRRHRAPFTTSTVRVSPERWLPAMISLAIIVSTLA